MLSSRMQPANQPVPNQSSSSSSSSAIQRLQQPSRLRIFACDKAGRTFFSEGVDQSGLAIQSVSYERLSVAPLLIEQREPPCFCEFILCREGALPHKTEAHPFNPSFPRLWGPFFVFKYVTAEGTLNRIQIDVSLSDKMTIMNALSKSYNTTRA